MSTVQTSRELAHRVAWRIGNIDKMLSIDEAIALIDAWVRVRGAEVLKESSYHQPNYNYYGDAESCTGCDWAIGDGTINWETHIQKLTTARKQLEEKK